MNRRSKDALERGDSRCPMMTAAVYMRKSTSTEGRSKSKDEQLAVCQSDAERFGFGRVVIFDEPEGKKGNLYWQDEEGRNPGPYRPMLTKLVNEIRNGNIQAVIVYKLNRLARDNGVEDGFVNLCLKYDVHLIVGGRDQEIDTARGRCNSAIEAARAKEYRDQNSEDIKRDHDFKFANGLFTRDPSCFGYRSKGRGTQQIKFMPKELEIVKQVFDWFNGRNGEMPLGPYQIATKCMKLGIRIGVGSKGHKIVYEGRVCGSQIKSILGNCMHMGDWQHNKQRKVYPQLFIPSEDGAPPKPLISQELWDETAARLANRPKLTRKRATSPRILSGLVVCGSCALPCHVSRKKLTNGSTIERWFCPRRTGVKKTCNGVSYSTCEVESLDQWVTDFVCPMVQLELTEVREEQEASSVRKEYEELQAKYEEAKKTEKLAIKRALGVMDDQAFKELVDELREERQQLELSLRDRKVLLGEIVSSGVIGDPKDLISQDKEIRRTALHRSLHWIALTDKGVIAYNKIGNYLPGRFVERDNHRMNDVDNRRKVTPPNFEDIVDCQHWIFDKRTFASGRRYVLGDRDQSLPLKDLIPDYVEPNH